MTVTDPPQPSRSSRPAQPGRRGRPGYDLESLLHVAVELFNERGYDGTSMEDLSRRLGITKSAIYHHVPSKQELLRLAVDRAIGGLFDVAEEVRTMPGPAIDRLEHLVRGSVHVLVDRLPFVTLLLRVHGNTEVERDALARRREFDRFVADLVKDAEAEGDIRPDIDPALTARLLFGLVNSLIEWYRPQRGIDCTELADAICKITFDGMRIRSFAASPQETS
ncbi:TetR/AcrR family transcriptional regulator [Actinobacteria bacterium YIM 96077]|uniref:TetR family transcriptional regulator n=1 Tax=Phytoactinopolyspora halophila TaxID=1981511 RepID=A0A329QT12_9ACTN|nr:TetR/AcrR family transcriptional regulator [Phytoactinopolyspora halophila]AYY14926.1 TetR/AcrR family transcriptional regulator [Actinobacteria bacterium YIM 96077]RAW15383.1 TetR family transcriptional regulator [Phytoactinopolyspora halophila]